MGIMGRNEFEPCLVRSPCADAGKRAAKGTHADTHTNTQTETYRDTEHTVASYGIVAFARLAVLAASCESKKYSVNYG